MIIQHDDDVDCKMCGNGQNEVDQWLDGKYLEQLYLTMRMMPVY